MRGQGVAVLACALLGCGDEAVREVSIPDRDRCYGQADTVYCDDGVAVTCRAGMISARRDCTAESLACAERRGCRACEPLATVCKGSERYVCRSDGTALDLVETCSPELQCGPTGCRDLCADARKDRSYLGCDYWPVFTSNRALASEFYPAVSVGNGNQVPAQITVTKGAQTVATRTVAAGAAETINLVFDDKLRVASGSSVVTHGAYHLRASVPVTVHQYNPLLYELDRDCSNERPEHATDMLCSSYTNDASLLLPSEALVPDAEDGSVRYLVTSRGPLMRRVEETYESLPGMLAVVGVGAAPVHVQVRSTAHTAASPSDPRIPPLAPGGTLDLTLAPGEVLQLLTAAPTSCPGKPSVTDQVYCDAGPAYDLTGSEVLADGPIEVIAGHDCANVPFDRPACDHLEESMVPLRTWGTRTLLTRPRVGAGVSSLLRVISGADGNAVTFEPAIHAPVTLRRGEWLELSASEPVLVQGSGRLTVAQYLIGQGHEGTYVGDPSLSIAVPLDQYRSEYTFLTPSTYELNFVDVVAARGDLVTLDGVPVGDFVAVGSSDYAVSSLQLPKAGGVHVVRSSKGSGIGIVLYGLGSYTSYMLPGGFSLQPLTGPVQ